MAASDEAPGRQRLDKWLWFARVVKTREAACSLVESGHVRLNGQKTLKPGHGVKADDVLTIVLNSRVRVLHVAGLAERRGPAEAARRLYREPGMSTLDEETP
ncbi:RNA-binding S4 domain-containing protein [Aestuariivirga litoralis]|uniref:RNA-binding S4 domain-containing protein n=1 Tax=Aestuariivirga litoralis TaxID=2650924 RepID=A0A2W2BRU3_9HYPH|nr:RNA-binding S4 domain-containing protein [Aestuariivirga litoralis]PZF78909.1 RNA-binding S4 domain-containing protein [Aestuariivirga litoralis]